MNTILHKTNTEPKSSKTSEQVAIDCPLIAQHSHVNFTFIQNTIIMDARIMDNLFCPNTTMGSQMEEYIETGERYQEEWAKNVGIKRVPYIKLRQARE